MTILMSLRRAAIQRAGLNVAAKTLRFRPRFDLAEASDRRRRRFRYIAPHNRTRLRDNVVQRLVKAACFAAAMLITAGAQAARTDVVVGMQLEPPNLDPTGGAAAAIREIVYANVFESLTRITQDGSVVPGLARSWNVSADGLAYTFHLATGASFHDGTPFDAADVKFPLDRARAPESTNPQKPLFT